MNTTGACKAVDMTRHVDHGDAVAALMPASGSANTNNSPPRARTSMQIRLELLQQLVVRRDRDHRHVLVDERQRAMLELAGRIGFGVDVGDFLELERPFHARPGAARRARGTTRDACRRSARRACAIAGSSSRVFSTSAGSSHQPRDQLALALGIRAVVLARARRSACRARSAAS